MIQLLQKQDFEQAASIVALAYPGMNIQTTEEKIKFVERLTVEQEEQNGINYFGNFNETGELLGIYRLNDFECNVNGKFQRVFGIGMVAVHLLHKKEKIAFQLLSHFHQYARQENVALVSLYPFNPSFYRKMGYGYGPMKYEYKIKPDALIANGDKGLVQFLSPNDEEAIVTLYNDYALQNHGMIKRTWTERRYIKNAATNYVGVVENDELIGALAFTLHPVKDSHFLHQHMVVHEWIWSKPNAYKQLASWLSSQQDQVDRIIFRTNDSSFLYALTNPLNDSNHLIPSLYHEVATAGVGLMYRITNIGLFVHEMNFQNLNRPDEYTRLLLEINDTFLKEQNGLYEFIYNGELWSATKVLDSNERANMKIGIHDLSSWWMGCVSLKDLCKYGEVTINNIDSNLLDGWFMPNTSPICFTSF
ncbi:GNAT family N-acetyltransferase [Psychrobacillus glaciei]|uniref:GNAT family N-acetyltransferase n=1 Tax=Psychrobacillus glaciei TaxID=2283160 RepID=A0A5J6SQR2_9BACI|nr:GNAT family N-acetyltransferase [Psychrobacillus glaciei]QFF99853.1 GNAT family N-acetyltransferase [Psychrobacillus glaciei]